MACFITVGEYHLFINDVDLSTPIGKRKSKHKVVILRGNMEIGSPSQVNYDIFPEDRKDSRGGLKDYFNVSWALKKSGYSWNKKRNKLVKKTS